MASQKDGDVKRSEGMEEATKTHSTQIAGEEFAVMLSKLLVLLSTKYSKPEEFQQLLITCMQLTVTNEALPILLISGEQKMKFGIVTDIHDLFTFFQPYWSWCDFDLLKYIVKLSEVAEASQLLEMYDYMTEWRIDLKKESNAVMDSHVMSHNFCKVVIGMDKRCEHMSKQEYRDLKSKLLDLGNLQEYSLFFNGEAFKPLLKVFMYIPVGAAEYLIKALQQAKNDLSQEDIIFIKVGETVLIDNTRSVLKEPSVDIKAARQIFRSANHSNIWDDESVTRSLSLVDVEAKVVVLGALGVGKTSITLRYIGNLFSLDVNPTIAASFFSFTVNVGQSKVKFQLWDTAGQERFRSMLPMYYRRANAAIIVYDVTSEESFINVTEWVKELQKNIPNEVALCIVGNKIDLHDKIKVPTERGQKLANSFNAAFVESSAKRDIGIHDIFCKTAVHIVDLKQKRIHESLAPDNLPFVNLPRTYTVVGHGHQPVPTKSSNPITPPDKPKRNYCCW